MLKFILRQPLSGLIFETFEAKIKSAAVYIHSPLISLS